ncbi:hypothetical protein QAD02_000450 [Eretmocerus hayati]|uniref:Uncharacterized protein n=1 Tax=Eretmocerus hayati TaxID=131215 RepID=A0ACC2NEY9_9HYME|nr:hypothetical protein QAD02_000450 [Eretmocerus hayati]
MSKRKKSMDANSRSTKHRRKKDIQNRVFSDSEDDEEGGYEPGKISDSDSESNSWPTNKKFKLVSRQMWIRQDTISSSDDLTDDREAESTSSTSDAESNRSEEESSGDEDEYFDCISDEDPNESETSHSESSDESGSDENETDEDPFEQEADKPLSRCSVESDRECFSYYERLHKIQGHWSAPSGYS